LLLFGDFFFFGDFGLFPFFKSLLVNDDTEDEVTSTDTAPERRTRKFKAALNHFIINLNPYRSYRCSSKKANPVIIMSVWKKHWIFSNLLPKDIFWRILTPEFSSEKPPVPKGTHHK